MFLEFFVVGFGEVPAVMHSPALTTRSGGLRHEQANGQHILALPACCRIENFIHYITLPEADDFLCLGQRLIRSGNTNISPHKRPQRIGDIFSVQTSTAGLRNVKFN